MSPLTLLLTSARPAIQWTRSRLGSSLVDHLLAPFEAGLGMLESCRVPVPVPIPYPPRRPRHAGVLALALALVAAAAPVQAQNYRPSGPWFDDTVDGQIVDVQVLVDGHAAPLYTASGRLDREYFQAFKGRNYALQLSNKTGRRVGVLIAVDGLNVVNGERSSLSRNESMYVLDPWESTVIRGWRTSLDDVRSFVFVDEERSYAERTGQANSDMGWIRVLAFRENEPFSWGAPGKVRDEAARPYGAAPESSNDKRATRGDAEQQPQLRADESNPGTGWGEHRYDPVQRTRFVAESRATDHLVLRYEYVSGLRALGIRPRPWNNGRDRTWERERGGFAVNPRW